MMDPYKTLGRLWPIVLLTVAGVFSPSVSRASTHYVSPTGSAGWSSCTNVATPCSWQTAMANAVADDLTYFRGGTYDVDAYCVGDYETIAMSPANSGSPGHYITFASYPGETPIVAPCSTKRSALAFGARNADYIIWDGFTGTMLSNVSGTDEGWYFGFIRSAGSIVRNMDFSSDSVTSYHNHAPIRIMDSSSNEIYNNYFHDILANSSAVNTGGIWLMQAEYAKIHNNTFYNSKRGVMQKDGPNIGTEIYMNFFSSLASDGIQLHEPFAGGTGLKIYQNVFVNVSGIAINLYDCAQAKDNYQIYNNTIYGAGTGIQVDSVARNTKIWNNIISESGYPFLRYYTGADMPSYSNYNNYYGSGNWNLNYSTDYTSLSAWRAATGHDANSIVADPGFLSAGSIEASGYRRNAYPANGRGGAYSSVMGAYINGNETIGIVLSGGAPNATVASASAASSGLEAMTSANIAVILSEASAQTVTVPYSVTGGTATASGTDYTLASGTLTFDPGTTTRNVSASIVNDTLVEPSETIVITLSSPTNATLGAITTHTYTIIDDDTPSAPTILFHEGFEDSSLMTRGWYDMTTLKLSSTEHVSGSTRSAEFHFTLGATVPEVSGGALRRKFTESDSVYISYYQKHSTNWIGSNRTYHPHVIHVMTNLEGDYLGPSTSHLTAYVEENSGKPVLAIQDALNIDQENIGQDLSGVTELRAVAGCNGYSTADGSGPEDCYNAGTAYRNIKSWSTETLFFQDAPGNYYKGDWHHIEAYFKLNSIVNGVGVADGIVRYWYDDVMIIDHPNVLFRTGQHPNMKFNQFLLSPYIGDGSPVDQTMWIDELSVATSRASTGMPNPPANLRIQ